MSSSITIQVDGESLALDVPETSQKITSIESELSTQADHLEALSAKLDTLERSMLELKEIMEDTDTPEDNPETLDYSIIYWESSHDGEVVHLTPGTYHTQFYVKHNNVSILGIPDDEGKYPVIDGRITGESLGLVWNDHGDGLWSAVIPDLPNLWHFIDGNSVGRERNHDAVHPLLCTIGDEPLKYNPDTENAPDTGEFTLSAPAGKPGVISVKLREWESIDEFMLSDKPWLIEGDPGITGLELKNLSVSYCSNTGKIGMVNTPGSNGVAENIVCTYANTIGFKFGSRESIHSPANLSLPAVGWSFSNIAANHNGQCGLWGKIKGTPSSHVLIEDYENSYNGWKGGHPWWEVSFKIIESCYVTFKRGKCIGNEGAGFWLDIWNTDIAIEELYCGDNLFCGVLLEHGLHRLSAKDITIAGTREFAEPDGNGGVWTVNAGLILQSNIENCNIEGLQIVDCEDGIRFNYADPRGHIKNNTITGYFHSDVIRPIMNIGMPDPSNTVASA